MTNVDPAAAITADALNDSSNSKTKDSIKESKNELFKWDQTLKDVELQFPNLENPKQFKVEFKRNYLKIYSPSKVLMDGELFGPIKLEESFWTIDKNTLVIQLEKVNKQEWWSFVVEGAGNQIDTTKIEPENSKLSDLDGETRSMVEKMASDINYRCLINGKSKWVCRVRTI